MKKALLFLAISISFFAFSTNHQVVVDNNFFSPQNLTVNVGDTVTWTNNSGQHNVNGTQATFPGNPASFTSGAAGMAWTYQFVFTIPGVYDYQCDPHAPSMAGTITVSSPPAGPCGDLFISEYIEGSSSNKAIEVYNPTSSPINLSGYALSAYNNGGTTATNTFNFPAINLPAYGVYVIANAGATAPFLSVSDTTSPLTFYNGDDAIVLFKNGDTLDIIGVVGVDPGASWPVGTGATAEFTLVRKTTVNQGQKDWAIGATEWDVYPQNTSIYLGSHSSVCLQVAASTIGFNNATLSVSEDSTGIVVAGTIAPALSSSQSFAVHINYQSASSADLNTIPAAVNDTIYFSLSAGDSTFSFTLNMVDDTIFEGNETAQFNLTALSSGLQFGLNNSVSLTILDNDSPPVTTGCLDLFFSEYVEGSSNNKALEIYNPTTSTINLSTYQVLLFSNGGTTPSNTLNFPSTTIAPGGVYVIANGNASAAILALADTLFGVTNFNGDDAIVLMNGADSLDIIGIVGNDPGTEWPVGTGSTLNNTLRRNATTQGGTKNWAISSTQWDVYPIDNIADLGAHTMIPCGASADPIVGFSSSGTSVNESVGTVSVNITILNSNANATSVDVSLSASSTATSGTDFNFTPNTVTFPAGTSGAQSVQVTIIDDTAIEGIETIVLTLSNLTNNATFGNNQSFTISIQDNDAPIPAYSVATITTNNADGVADSAGVYCSLTGTVVGPNFRPQGLTFMLYDGTGGINVFSNGASSGYVVNQGDSIRVIGAITQFNGLTQIVPDSIVLISANGTVPAPMVATDLGENTESELTRMNGFYIINPSQWTNTGAGFNVNISNGTTTVEMRIDADINLYGQAAPVGVFDVIGIGGQFDGSSPYTSGYQILPRSTADIILYTSTLGQVLINEIETPGLSATDDQGDIDPWVEIYNFGTTDVDISGYFLSSNPSNKTMYRIPLDAGAVVEAGMMGGNHLLIWLDNEDSEGPLHTNFGFVSGEWLGLASADGNTWVDSITMPFGEPVFGRFPDGSASWIASGWGLLPSPGASNYVWSLPEPETISVKTYPNPATSSFIIEQEQEGLIAVTILDALGKVVFESAWTERVKSIDLSFMSKGMYVVKVEQNGKFSSTRILKM
jgi:predicted extracellular nuclease